MTSLNWSSHQLTEYFEAVSGPDDEQDAVLVAIERTMEALDAEFGAVVIGGRVIGCLGLGRGEPPAGLAGLAPGLGDLAVPGLGDLHLAVTALKAPGEPGRSVSGTMLLGRADGEFGPEEEQLLQGMAQALGLVLRNLRALATERTRHQLLGRLLEIQRAISHRKPLQEVLDAVTAGVSGLLGQAAVWLVLTDPLDSARLIVASRFGQAGACPGDPRDHADGTDDPAAVEAAAEAMGAAARGRDAGLETEATTRGQLIAAPVYVNEDIAGSLVVQVGEAGTQIVERRELLVAFAQQVSLALTDARTVEAMREAYHDSLTGLPNRALFLDRLQHARQVASRRSDELVVLFIDLDRFKAVNDSLGHKAGDQLLAAVADRIRACMRACDTAARLGGDEFAVLLEGAQIDDGLRVARRIIAAVSEPVRVSGRDVFVGASIGVAPGRSADGDPEDLLSNADVAMYRAKRSGTGRTAVFEPQMHNEALERLNLQSHLQRALAHEEFWLQYQPLVHLDSGVPVAVEALARWTHPQRGIVPPKVFIPIAEETDAVLDLGRWALWHAARQVTEWRAVLPGLGLNVNVSPRQIVDGRFAEDVADVLAATGLAPGSLTLELTESVLMSDPDTASLRLHELRDVGARLAVDDFGTGFSSLSYLRQFPVDQVKIDRSFVAGIGQEGSEDLALARTIVELGRILRMETVAEGIETPAQEAALRRLGCEYGQGFHLARPMDPPAARAYLERFADAQASEISRVHRPRLRHAVHHSSDPK